MKKYPANLPNALPADFLVAASRLDGGALVLLEDELHVLLLLLLGLLEGEGVVLLFVGVLGAGAVVGRRRRRLDEDGKAVVVGAATNLAVLAAVVVRVGDAAAALASLLVHVHAEVVVVELEAAVGGVLRPG